MRNIKLIFTIAVFTFLFQGCTEETPETNPFIILKTGSGLVADGSYVSPGGKMQFGISATGGGGVITNLVVKRNADGVIVTEIDEGLYITSGGLNTTLTFNRSYATTEKWTFFIMNSYRDTASVSLTVLKGSGSAYGDINFFPSVTIGLQKNTSIPQFLDLHTGIAYNNEGVSGNEALVDLAMYWYMTSGKSSPSLSCPGYPAAQTYYPAFTSWATKNKTTYDYGASDYDLVSAEKFDEAKNDSLLVVSYNPQTVSSVSKFAYTGKVVPFKTTDGKYGLLKIIRADEEETGSVELAIKIQK